MLAPMGWKSLFGVVMYSSSAPHIVQAGGGVYARPVSRA